MSIISAFPGTGKSYYAKNPPKGLCVYDMESSEYSREQFPSNYIDAIQNKIEQSAEGVLRSTLNKADILLISSHKAVRDGLIEKNIPFALIYPDMALKDEYMERYRNRGNTESFLSLLDKMWYDWISECEHETSSYVTKCKLFSGQYLSDVI